MRHTTHIPQGHETCNRIYTLSQCLTQVFGSAKELSSPKCSKVKPAKEIDITPLYSITQLTDNEGKTVLREEQKKQVELKPLPSHLRYEFLKDNKNLPVIVNVDLSSEQIAQLLPILEKYRRVIGYSIEDMIGISPLLCTHRIFLEDGCKPSREHQKRLNPTLQDVVKKEILMLLTTKIIYPISDSEWVSPIHVVPKKGESQLLKMKIVN
jgi:hypothetical protein